MQHGMAQVWRKVVVVVTVAATAALMAPAAANPGDPGRPSSLAISVLSSRPDQVSGGDTLVRVDVPRTVPLGQVTITRNGVDVTDKFSRASDGRALFSFE
jgi:hypothetical protein